MAENRHIDQQKVREHIDNVLIDCEQVFEKFFLAKFIGLNFSYLPENAQRSDKKELKITFNINEMRATIEMKIQYLRPVRQGQVICRGRFIKKGRTVSFMESRLLDESGKLAAIATATWKMPD